MNGQGTYTYPNGDVYEGTFLRDIKLGQGVLKYGNGEVYDGAWEKVGVGRGQGGIEAIRAHL